MKNISFQNESFYPSKRVLLQAKTSPFESQKDNYSKRDVFCYLAGKNLFPPEVANFFLPRQQKISAETLMCVVV